MVTNCDKCGRFTSADSDDEHDFCDECWYARLHRYGPTWWAVRSAVLQRDNYRCQRCGISNTEAKEKYNEELSVHHMEPYDDGGTHDHDNLRSLCKGCHALVEGFD